MSADVSGPQDVRGQMLMLLMRVPVCSECAPPPAVLLLAVNRMGSL